MPQHHNDWDTYRLPPGTYLVHRASNYTRVRPMTEAQLLDPVLQAALERHKSQWASLLIELLKPQPKVALTKKQQQMWAQLDNSLKQTHWLQQSSVQQVVDEFANAIQQQLAPVLQQSWCQELVQQLNTAVALTEESHGNT